MLAAAVAASLVGVVVLLGSSHAIEGVEADTILAGRQSRNGLVGVVVFAVMLSILEGAIGAVFRAFPSRLDVVVVKSGIDDILVCHINPLCCCLTGECNACQEQGSK